MTNSFMAITYQPLARLNFSFQVRVPVFKLIFFKMHNIFP